MAQVHIGGTVEVLDILITEDTIPLTGAEEEEEGEVGVDTTIPTITDRGEDTMSNIHQVSEEV